VLRLEAGTHDAQLLADASGITKTPNLLIIKYASFREFFWPVETQC